MVEVCLVVECLGFEQGDLKLYYFYNCVFEILGFEPWSEYWTVNPWYAASEYHTAFCKLSL